LQLIDARLPSGNNSHRKLQKKKEENVGKKVNAKIELDVVGWCPRPVGSLMAYRTWDQADGLWYRLTEPTFGSRPS